MCEPTVLAQPLRVVLTERFQYLQNGEIVLILVLIIENAIGKINVPRNLLADGVALWHLYNFGDHLQKTFLGITK